MVVRLRDELGDHFDTVSAYLVDLCAAVEEIGRLRWRLAQIIALADAAPTITNERLRDRLLALAESCTR
jgi:hypothetical protein